MPELHDFAPELHETVPELHELVPELHGCSRQSSVLSCQNYTNVPELHGYRARITRAFSQNVTKNFSQNVTNLARMSRSTSTQTEDDTHTPKPLDWGIIL